MFCLINNKNKELVLFFKLNKIKQKILFFKTFRNNIIKTLKKTKIYEKKLLKLIGVGFKVTLIKNIKYNILCFKLGFSHLIFIRIPIDVYVKTLKNVLYLSCFNKLKLFKLCNLIKNLKIPDAYKGKGFFFEYEKFLAKKGKKV
jgi:ribosomal protein L6P/L9E